MLRDAERPEVCGGKSAAALFCAAVGHCRLHPPRDGDQRAGHRAGLVRRQEQHDRGELGRLHPVVEAAFGMSRRLAGVSMIEGSTALTVTPFSFSSSARLSVNRCTADLLAA